MADKLTEVPAFTNTDTVINFPVTFKAGSVVTSITDATLDLRAKTLSGAEVIGSATVTGPAAVQGVFPAYTLAVGVYTGQLWAEKGGQRVMLAEFKMPVAQGFRPPQ